MIRTLFFVLTAVSVLAGVSARAASIDGPPAGPDFRTPEPAPGGDGFLHFPGFPPIPIRPRDPTVDAGGQGQTGPFGQTQGKPARRVESPPPKPLTPEEKAASIGKALAPRPPVAEVRRRTLDGLYAKLATARDEDEAKGLASLIGGIWMRSDSDTANLLMQRASASIEAKDFPLALKLLDRLVELQPDWPEAWNKRASARFFSGDLDGSMEDIGQVLKLEPRHFGALEGMAAILQRTGFNKRALEIYRRALAIYPHQSAVEKIVEKLTLDVEGQGI
ncbi:MAG: hypothetical protein P4L76_01460 [Beijerinckiaceae bacterium]|nr:hypothetical protein [Beijerinckiaceae bacterium]